MKRNKTFWWIGVIVVVIFALLVAPQFSGETRAFRARMTAAGAECLNNGHTNLAQHIHAKLKIIVDGVDQAIPANTGIIKTCMAELHTHDETGEIHIETVLASKRFKLKDFFTIWGQEFDRPGYELNMTVNKNSDSNMSELVLKDKQEIILTYNKPNN